MGLTEGKATWNGSSINNRITKMEISNNIYNASVRQNILYETQVKNLQHVKSKKIFITYKSIEAGKNF